MNENLKTENPIPPTDSALVLKQKLYYVLRKEWKEIGSKRKTCLYNYYLIIKVTCMEHPCTCKECVSIVWLFDGQLMFVTRGLFHGVA